MRISLVKIITFKTTLDIKDTVGVYCDKFNFGTKCYGAM